jgi:histidinol-phosphate/aromatic aminotransferase/cobyric acid decarboxylase-like protein
MIYVSLEDVDPFSVEAVGNYEEELEVTQSNGIKVRALLISNPHNPPGIKLTRQRRFAS